MQDNLLTPENEAQQNTQQISVPDKFKDPQTGAVRVDALLSSYLALEKKLSGMVSRPNIPDSPDGYCVECNHGLFTVDAELNKTLHEKGFTQEQVQTVYDAAAQKLVPMILEISADVKADREIERLVAAFDGEEKWREVSRQLLAFGQRTMPADVLDNMASSFEGVMALYRMMKGQEPGLGFASEAASTEGAGDLQAMMRDPRYWRDRDPSFVAKVTDGFKKMYAQ
jgi:hypothetical protein